ncbi:polyprenyl synthetase family protein, partial [Rhodovulum sulfidophilum]
EGEVLQLTAAQDLGTTEEIYLKVVRGKTAALFAAATEVGGVIAGMPEEQVKALHTYGDALGVGFQIVDDLLDVAGDAASTGKNIGDDFRERKLTLPIIKTIAKADEAERTFWARTIEKGDQRDGDLEHALELMAKHGAIEATRQEALAWTARAKEALSLLPEHEIRDMLSDLADYVVARIS